MLAEVAAEVLHFLSRRDLDKACAVNKWLDATIAQCCDVYPLRPVSRVELLPYSKGFQPDVVIKTGGLRFSNSFRSVDEALYFACSLLRHSCVGLLQLGKQNHGKINLSPGHWAALIDAIRSGAIRYLWFIGVDFSELDNCVFLIAVGLRGLQSLVIERSVVPSGVVTDDIIRSGVATGLFGLFLWDNISDTPHGFSGEAVLGFFFRADPAPGGRKLNVTLDSTGVTDTFLSKFFERLRSSPVLAGSLEFLGATPEQRGLSAYAQYLVSSEDADDVYRFPSGSGSDKTCYEVTRYDSDDSLSMHIGKVYRRS